MNSDIEYEIPKVCDVYCVTEHRRKSHGMKTCKTYFMSEKLADNYFNEMTIINKGVLDFHYERKYEKTMLKCLLLSDGSIYSIGSPIEIKQI